MCSHAHGAWAWLQGGKKRENQRWQGRRMAWKSGGDQLSGQCNLDGVTVLVENVQARFGYIA